ncbi:antibiotic biosynthesis monooxygenase [Streptomyces sp. Je 1-369]|uniref:antibiotic biosynthesis monooxygenase n=1 Tax=Streptomyces sp. Je 1-369 TaxID=2966192 RepID=UPI0022862124|nr:antibiotic biosynthesis monooxygenase [Streptomyces sp. Je 1-369]WAL94798.1 antibiotic biosynthesis monooxygenase [Streptomyces sp. Je 1-369]
MPTTPTPTLSTGALPDPARADGGLTFISTWSTGSPERLRATLDAIAKAWETRPWPHEGLLSYTVYAGADGSTVLHYSQWRDEAAYQDFFAGVGNGRDARNSEIDAAVPGIERLGLNKTRLYRSWSGGRAGEVHEPGTVVIGQTDFGSPDPEGQRARSDRAVEALDGGTADGPGPYAAHFHLTLDGKRVITYAEGGGEGARYRFAYGFVPSKA